MVDFLSDLVISNKKLRGKVLAMLRDLPLYFCLHQNIKFFRHGEFRCFELRVKQGSNICRFFFIVDGASFIVFHGFIKKTQKTNIRDIRQGEKNMKDYFNNKFVIDVDLLY